MDGKANGLDHTALPNLCDDMQKPKTTYGGAEDRWRMFLRKPALNAVPINVKPNATQVCTEICSEGRPAVNL